MNKLESERTQNKVLYRELFVQADKTFKEQLNKLKENITCLNCSDCCEIRYSKLSPSEIYKLSLEEDVVSHEYIKDFVPYGADNSFDYKNNLNFSIELNNKLALEINKDYTSHILEKAPEPVYFYFCRHFDKNNKCECALKEKSFMCNDFPNSVTTVLSEKCGYANWQKLCVDKITKEIRYDIKTKINEIIDYRKNFSCKRTGTCC